MAFYRVNFNFLLFEEANSIIYVIIKPLNQSICCKINLSQG